MWLLRRRIDLARSGAWSAAIRHAPRALGGAVVTKGRAQLIKETFCMGVILALASCQGDAEPGMDCDEVIVFLHEFFKNGFMSQGTDSIIKRYKDRRLCIPPLFNV